MNRNRFYSRAKANSAFKRAQALPTLAGVPAIKPNENAPAWLAGWDCCQGDRLLLLARAADGEQGGLEMPRQ